MNDESKRESYELSREEIRLDRKRQEREEEERQREEWENECARRLARYDEAVRLLRRAEPFMTLGLSELIMDFLAAEPKTEERFPLEEVAPEEAQRRYLKSMKTEERNG